MVATESRFMPLLVGIAGYAQVGKDSTARVFEELGYEHVAFADALRNLAWDLNPVIEWNSWSLHGRARYRELIDSRGYEQAKERVPGFRQFLKDLGNGCRKHIGPDVWVRACLDNTVGHTVISDVRFENEADAIRGYATERGGLSLLIRVDRPGVGPESDFEREIPNIPVDVVVNNDGTLDDLRSTVLDVCGDFMLAAAER